MLNHWFSYVLIYLFVTAIWGIIAKFNYEGMSWETNLTFIWLPAFILNAIFVFPKADFHFTKYHWIGIVGGILAFIGTVVFYKALEKGEASRVIPLTNLYMVFVFILAIIFLREKITIQKVMGLVLGMGAIYLLK